ATVVICRQNQDGRISLAHDIEAGGRNSRASVARTWLEQNLRGRPAGFEQVMRDQKPLLLIGNRQRGRKARSGNPERGLLEQGSAHADLQKLLGKTGPGERPEAGPGP